MALEKTPRKNKIILIGGTDNIGGAGVIADVKTAEFFNCYSAVVVTCVTAQDFNNVYQWNKMSPAIVIAQLNALMHAKLAFQYAKISLLPSKAQINQVSDWLQSNKTFRLIYDSVFVKNNDFFFLTNAQIKLLVSKIIPFAYVTSSNYCEFIRLLKLAKIEFSNKEALVREKLESMIAMLCSEYLQITRYIVRGVKLQEEGGTTVVNILYNHQHFEYFGFIPRTTTNDHGTGCAFTTALTCNLAHGLSLSKSCRQATNYATTCVRLADHDNEFDCSINFNQK